MPVLDRPLPVITRKRAGKIRPKGLVRAIANGWSSQCNYPGVSGSGKVIPNQQRRDNLGFPHHHSRTIAMSDKSEANIATADALTLLLHNQHALAASMEEVIKWLSENGVGGVAANAMAAMETLDTNAQAITDAIMRLRL